MAKGYIKKFGKPERMTLQSPSYGVKGAMGSKIEFENEMHRID